MESRFCASGVPKSQNEWGIGHSTFRATRRRRSTSRLDRAVGETTSRRSTARLASQPGNSRRTFRRFAWMSLNNVCCPMKGHCFRAKRFLMRFSILKEKLKSTRQLRSSRLSSAARWSQVALGNRSGSRMDRLNCRKCDRGTAQTTGASTITVQIR